MATNQQRREAAKRKLDRQLARRAERARRRKIIGVAATVGVVVVVGGLIVFLTTRGDNGGQANAADQQTSTPPPATSGPCKYTPSESNPAAKPVGMPPDSDPTPATGTVPFTLKTNHGDIAMQLDRAKAPCTVQSMTSLAQQKYFDGTKCHRLTSKDPLKVLQCGDPKGNGSGGPGYTIKDEPPKDLKPSADGKTATYPRGTLAMAKSSAPNSGGSQFFIVYADSTLPPQYTVFGTVTEPGLQVVDKIAAAGDDGSMNPSPGGGAPKTPVEISTVTVG